LFGGIVTACWLFRWQCGSRLIKRSSDARNADCAIRLDHQISLKEMFLVVTVCAIVVSMGRLAEFDFGIFYTLPPMITVASLLAVMPTMGFMLGNAAPFSRWTRLVLYHYLLLPTVIAVSYFLWRPPDEDTFRMLASLVSLWAGLTGTSLAIAVMMRNAGYRLMRANSITVALTNELLRTRKDGND
jgi:hypothetical protein